MRRLRKAPITDVSVSSPEDGKGLRNVVFQNLESWTMDEFQKRSGSECCTLSTL
jgi:hypothetical protein